MSYTDRQTLPWEEEGEERPRRHRDPDPDSYDPEEEYYRELEGDPEEDLVLESVEIGNKL